MTPSPNSAEALAVDNTTADVAPAAVAGLGIVAAELAVVDTAAGEEAGVVFEEDVVVVGERTVAARGLAAYSAVVAEEAGDISLDLAGLVAGAAQVAVGAQTSVLDLVRRSRNSVPDLLRVRRLVGLKSDWYDWVRIVMNSGSIVDLTLFLESAFVVLVDLGAFVVAVVQPAGLAAGRAFDSVEPEVVAEGTGRELEAAGSNLIPAEADRKMTCVVVGACHTEFDMLPEAAVAADESPVAAAEACSHPFAAPGLCNNSPSLLPRPLVLVPMQCWDTSLLAAYWLANIGSRKTNRR